MKGRPIRGFFAGLFLGIFLDLDLALSGLVKLNSIILTILPIALIILGVILGLWAPVGRWRAAPAKSRSSNAPPVFAGTAPSAASDPADPEATTPDPAEAAPTEPAAPTAAPPTEETPPI